MIKPGEVVACAILFLRKPPYTARTSGGELQIILDLMERTKDGDTKWKAVWTGPAAESFLRQHEAALKPGCALNLTLTRLRARDNELHGVIYAAILAPARWPARAANDATPAPPPAAAATDSIAAQPAAARAGA